jgi:hypothetical protein
VPRGQRDRLYQRVIIIIIIIVIIAKIIVIIIIILIILITTIMPVPFCHVSCSGLSGVIGKL